MDKNKYNYIMIKMKKDGLIVDDINIQDNFESIELIETNTQIKPPTFDYIKILTTKYKNKIKLLYLFDIPKYDKNSKYFMFKDLETEKILNAYNNYKFNTSNAYDEDSQSDLYIYNNFCNTSIKLDINDYDFFTDIIIQPMIINIPLSPI